MKMEIREYENGNMRIRAFWRSVEVFRVMARVASYEDRGIQRICSKHIYIYIYVPLGEDT